MRGCALGIMAMGIAEVTAEAFASVQFPQWGTPIMDPTLTTHTCYSCLRSHHNWIFDSAHYYESYSTEPKASTLPNQQCCQQNYNTLTNSNCAKYKDSGNNVITNRVPSEKLNPDLALAACPNWSTVCGNLPYHHYVSDA